MRGRPPKLFGEPVIRVITSPFTTNSKIYVRTILWIYVEAVNDLNMEENQEYLIELIRDGFVLKQRKEKKILELVFKTTRTNCRTALQIVTEKFSGMINEGFYHLASKENGSFTFKKYIK